MVLKSALLAEVKAFALGPHAFLSAAAFLVVAYFIGYLIKRPPGLNLPVIDRKGTTYGPKDLLEASRKYPDTPYVLQTSPPLVVLPPSTIEEVRNLPENQVSFIKDVRRMFAAEHTGIGEVPAELIKAIKFDLNRNLASILDGLQEEIRYAFNKEFGPCEDWTTIKLFGKLTRVVALLSSFVFVGRPLSREGEWLDLIITYTTSVLAARNALLNYPMFVRPFIAPFLKEIKKIKNYRTRGGELLDPIVKARLVRKNNENFQIDDSQSGQGAFISWAIRHMGDKDRVDPLVLATQQIVLSFAAIHTTSMAAWHAIFDLACRPEYIQPLRDEINKVITEDCQDVEEESFPKLKKGSLTKLQKLDSFLKESQRLSPPGLTSNTRVTTAPLSLSTGHTLPKGTRICFPSYAIHTSPLSTTFSPSYNPPSAKPPSEFDGFRFYNLRTMEGKENLHQFTTTSTESLNFGHGNHACAGRFFASDEMKLILVELLRNWDFRLKGNVNGIGGEDKRPQNLFGDLVVLPDPRAEIELRRKV
ncbi:MAG: hypothetical protein M1839_004346 [Geoglossum umbratile]|nr:MAG: hypothetical protein M1839_004346 [Geoglossum umbratile]